jgi:hypothetical protein
MRNFTGQHAWAPHMRNHGDCGARAGKHVVHPRGRRRARGQAAPRCTPPSLHRPAAGCWARAGQDQQPPGWSNSSSAMKRRHHTAPPREHHSTPSASGKGKRQRAAGHTKVGCVKQKAAHRRTVCLSQRHARGWLHEMGKVLQRTGGLAVVIVFARWCVAAGSCTKLNPCALHACACRRVRSRRSRGGPLRRIAD